MGAGRWRPLPVPAPDGYSPPLPIVVWLTIEQARYADPRGLKRMTFGRDRGDNYEKHVRNRSRDEQQGNERLGARAELAVEIAAGRPWDISLNRWQSERDVIGVGEVKHTPSMTGCLILRRGEHANDWFYLVTGDGLLMTIRGRIRREEATATCANGAPNRFWATPPTLDDGEPAWWIAQWALHPASADILDWANRHPDGRQSHDIHDREMAR